MKNDAVTNLRGAAELEVVRDTKISASVRRFVEDRITISETNPYCLLIDEGRYRTHGPFVGAVIDDSVNMSAARAQIVDAVAALVQQALDGAMKG